jgi:hypothetical protein
MQPTFFSDHSLQTLSFRQLIVDECLSLSGISLGARRSIGFVVSSQLCMLANYAIP